MYCHNKAVNRRGLVVERINWRGLLVVVAANNVDVRHLIRVKGAKRRVLTCVTGKSCCCFPCRRSVLTNALVILTFTTISSHCLQEAQGSGWIRRKKWRRGWSIRQHFGWKRGRRIFIWKWRGRRNQRWSCQANCPWSTEMAILGIQCSGCWKHFPKWRRQRTFLQQSHRTPLYRVVCFASSSSSTEIVDCWAGWELNRSGVQLSP